MTALTLALLLLGTCAVQWHGDAGPHSARSRLPEWAALLSPRQRLLEYGVPAALQRHRHDRPVAHPRLLIHRLWRARPWLQQHVHDRAASWRGAARLPPWPLWRSLVGGLRGCAARAGCAGWDRWPSPPPDDEPAVTAATFAATAAGSGVRATCCRCLLLGVGIAEAAWSGRASLLRRLCCRCEWALWHLAGPGPGQRGGHDVRSEGPRSTLQTWQLHLREHPDTTADPTGSTDATG